MRKDFAETPIHHHSLLTGDYVQFIVNCIFLVQVNKTCKEDRCITSKRFRCIVFTSYPTMLLSVYNGEDTNCAFKGMGKVSRLKKLQEMPWYQAVFLASWYQLDSQSGRQQRARAHYINSLCPYKGAHHWWNSIANATKDGRSWQHSECIVQGRSLKTFPMPHFLCASYT